MMSASRAYKTNPLDQARAPTGYISEEIRGIKLILHSYRSKVGTGGKVVRFEFLVTIYMTLELLGARNMNTSLEIFLNCLFH